MGFLTRMGSVIKNLKIRFYNSIARRSLYRFVIRDLFENHDVNIASDLLATEYFKKSSLPVEIQPNPKLTYLVFAPHQDDESIGAGGTLLRLANSGASIHVVFATDGKQETLGVSSESSVEIRRQEAQKACRKINATMHELLVDNITLEFNRTQISRLVEIIAEISPDVIMTPWLLDSPPKHRACNELLHWSLLISKGNKPEIWGYQVHNSLFPNAIVDITGYEQEKRKLIQIYDSQLQHDRAYDHFAIGIAAWNSRLLSCIAPYKAQYAEVFFVLPAIEYLSLSSSMMNRRSEMYTAWPRLGARIEQIGRSVELDCEDIWPETSY